MTGLAGPCLDVSPFTETARCIDDPDRMNSDTNKRMNAIANSTYISNGGIRYVTVGSISCGTIDDVAISPIVVEASSTSILIPVDDSIKSWSNDR